MHDTIAVPAIAAFMISVLAGPIVIPFLKRLKVGQTVRTEGPQTHLKKNGTPTMGGILILSAILVVSLFYVRDYPRMIPILFLTLGFGLVGFLDDYIKVVLMRSMGLSPLQKLCLQLLVTGIYAFYLVSYTNTDLSMRLPFMEDKLIDFGFLNIPVLFFIVLATVNGTNLTDGLDGLAGSVTVIVTTFFSVVAIGTESGIEPVTCAVAGALLGFLLFNVHPASVFMGDTGSLALGGFVVSAAYALQLPLFIPIVGIVYLIEASSVILQVAYFKITGGKRIFRMAPLHHHFELGGWSEAKVTAVFSILTAIFCLVALLGLQ
ncbi:MAG: phospho-N-acetylmuramoyl-pentapeptide-transferase [Lachnospiraceae bacterium]|nr:phospho-N-acetylmuramoyl-pentapeptide-transferase [Lachnospiraceae bacterium]MBD5509713.1 phospho-N-acetylmuramoyl-pentapeptide-transferase [Lachnospiraceae bacterium]